MPDAVGPPTPRSCPDCGVAMEPGYVPDFAHAGVVPTRWHPRMPEYHHTFFGLEVGDHQLKVDHAALLPVVTWRCPTCHLLRSYAE